MSSAKWTPKANAVLFLLLLLGALEGCRTAPAAEPAAEVAAAESHDEEFVRESIARALRLADRGDFEKAIQRLRRIAEKDGRAPTPADSHLYFTIGWLYGELGDSTEGGGLEFAEPEAWYRRAIAAEDDEYRTAAEYNLAVSLRTLGRSSEARSHAESAAAAEGADLELVHRAQILSVDLALEAGDWQAALVLARAAYASTPEAGEAPLRLLLLLGVRDADDTFVLSWSELFELAESFARNGHSGAAASVFEVLMAYRQEPAGVEPALTRRSALERWLEIQARLGALSPVSLEGLPDEWPDDALAQVKDLVLDPTQDSALGEWQTVGQRALIALALQSQAGNLALEREARKAEIVYRRALAVAPRPEEIGNAGTLDVGTDTALDLVLLYHANPSLLDAHESYPSWFTEYQTGSEKLLPGVSDDRQEPTDDPELLDGERVVFVPRSDSQLGSLGFIKRMWPNEAAFASTRDRLLATPEGKQGLVEFHSVLGLVFHDRKRWRRNDWLHSPLHLQRAIQTYRKYFDEPLPYLREKLADGLEKYGRPEDAVAEYRRAAREYLDIEARGGAVRCMVKADELYDDTTEALLRGLREVEDVLFPQHGWYLGGAAGLTNMNTSSGDLLKDLLDDGESVSDVDLDDDRAGVKGYVGYRFDGPWALELGYTSLEGAKSKIQATASPSLEGNVKDEHPVGGEGPTLALLWHPFHAKTWSVYGKVGVWYWESELDVNLNGSHVGFPDKDGFDPFLGLGADYALSPRVGLRLEAERYYIDDDDIDMISIGGFLKF